MNVIIEVIDYSYDEDLNFGTVEVLMEDYSSDSSPDGYPVNKFKANFSLSPDEEIPKNSLELCLFFEELNLIWEIVPD